MVRPCSRARGTTSPPRYSWLSYVGHLLNTVDLAKTVNETPDHANPFHEPQSFIVNLAIGGTSGGDPSKTPFPARLEVDWIRVWQREADATHDGH